MANTVNSRHQKLEQQVINNSFKYQLPTTFAFIDYFIMNSKRFGEFQKENAFNFKFMLNHLNTFSYQI